MNRPEAIVAWVQRFRWPLLAALIAVTVAAAFGAMKVGVDNAVDIWFPSDDPALQDYRAFQQSFGNDEVVVVALHDAQGILTPAGLDTIRAVGKIAAGVEGIAKVRSVVNVPSVRGSPGVLEVGPVLEDGPIDAASAFALQEQLGIDPLLRQLVSDDARTAVVIVEMAAMDDIDQRRDAVLSDLRAQLASFTPSYAGIGVIYAALNEASTRGAAGVMTASYLMILLLLWRLMGRWRSVMLILGAVGIGAVWVLGLYGVSGRDINMVTMVMPTLVLVIGVSDCVHMLVHVADQPMDKPPRDRVRDGIGQVLLPCLFNTLTTSMGFLALASASMPVIRDLGVFCAVGLVAAFVVALVLCTIVGEWEGFLPTRSAGGWTQGWVDRLADLSVRKPGPVLAAAAIVGLVAALGVTRIVVDTYSIDFLRADHPVRQDSERIEQGYGPYTPIEFVVHRAEGVRDPATLQAIAKWQSAMEASAEVGWTRSAADVVSRLDAVMSGRDVGRVPDNPSALAQLLFMYESDPDGDLPQYIDASGTLARVTVGVPMGSAREFGQRIDRLLALSALPAGVEVSPGGYIPLYVRIMDRIVSSQLRSFAIAFAVIFALIGILFRSGRAALLAVPANLLPVLCTLGLMGVAGIRLDVATVTIAAIVLGLVVDDTVQFLYRFQMEQARNPDIPTAVRAAVKRVGRPMAVTTLVLAGGFAVLGLATIKSVAWFGLLLAVALLSALVSDLLVVPALIVMISRPAGADEAPVAG
jgi:predicted RND superfamily exporter protein